MALIAFGTERTAPSSAVRTQSSRMLVYSGRALHRYCSHQRSTMCTCIVDGIMIATTASPGQRTLTIAAEKAPPGAMAVVVIRSKKTGAEVKYTVVESWLPKLGEWNRTLDAAGRYEQVIQASGLFQVT